MPEQLVARSQILSPVFDVGAAAITLVSAYAGALVRATAASTSAVTVTIPTNATDPIPVGTEIQVRRTALAQLSFVPASGVTLVSQNSQFDAPLIIGVLAILVKEATNEWSLRYASPAAATSTQVEQGQSNGLFVSPKGLLDAQYPTLLTYAATTNIDLSAGINFAVVLGGAVSFTFTNSPLYVGRQGFIYVKQNATGGYAASFTSGGGGNWVYEDLATPPGLNLGANAMTRLWYEVLESGYVIIGGGKPIAGGARTIEPDHPGYTINRTYTQRRAAAVAAVTLTSGRRYAVPFYFARPVILRRINVNITTAGTGNSYPAIHANNAALSLPGNVLGYCGPGVTNVTGLQQQYFSTGFSGTGDITLQAGMYWVSYAIASSGAGLTGMNSADTSLFEYLGAAAAGAQGAFTGAGSTAQAAYSDSMTSVSVGQAWTQAGYTFAPILGLVMENA